MNAKSLSMVLLLLASGCATGPDYRSPGTRLPEQWGEAIAGGTTNHAGRLCEWWKNFHDPELDSLVARAVQTNLNLRIAEARVREARARQGITEAGQWPTVDAAGGYARQKQSENQPIIGSLDVPPSVPFENNLYNAGFDARWELDLFGGTRRAVEAARADLAAMEYEQRDALVTLLAEVARNYVQTRGGQRELALLKSQIAVHEETVAVTRSRLAHGSASELDLQRALALLAAVQSQVAPIETAVRRSTHRLAVLLAQPPGALHQELGSAAPVPPLPPEVPVGLPSDLLQRRPDIRRAERQLAGATARVGQRKADLFPRFFLTGAAGFSSVDTGNFFSESSAIWSIGPSVRWRVFDYGRVRAEIRAQTAVQDQASLAFEQTVLSALEEVENALVAYAKEQERRGALERAVSANQNAVEIAGQLYAKGLGRYLNLLDAQRALYSSQIELARSEQTVALNLIALYKAMGGGWEG